MKAEPLPKGFGLALDRTTRRVGVGLLTGGSPWRLVRLTPAGTRQVDRWVAGAPVGPTAGAAQLARRLIDAGMAHPVPPPGAGGGLTVSVVIPVRDRPVGLAATLVSLGTHPAIIEVVVVDDASRDPSGTAATVAAVATPAGTDGKIRAVARTTRGGPAGARNTGWRAAKGDLVAFLDADCLPADDWLDRLVGHLADPTVGAAAPRVVAVPGPGTPDWLTRYEVMRSPLDLGHRPAPVRARSPVPYVPTAALLVRRRALADLGGFDESMPVGEDVDLIWDLAEAGWRIRYEPAARVGHPVRPDVLHWLLQRYGYGTSAAPLAARHGHAVSPLDISPWSAAAWLAAVTISPLAGGAVVTGATAVLVARHRRRVPLPTLLRLAVVGHLTAGRAAADATRRVWWPLVAIAAFPSRRARTIAFAAAIPLVGEWLLGRPRPGLGLLRWTALRLVDDAAYGVGVWSGVLRTRQPEALLPRRPARFRPPST